MVLAWLQKCTPDYLKLSEVSTMYMSHFKFCFVDTRDDEYEDNEDIL